MRLGRTDSPGRPSRLSHSSWTMWGKVKVNMVLNVHRNYKAYKGRGEGGKGGRGYGGGGRGRLYTCRYTVTTRMTCIKKGSDKSHFNVSSVVRDKVTRQCPQITTFLKRKESRSGIEPRSFRLPAYRLTARPNRLKLWGAGPRTNQVQHFTAKVSPRRSGRTWISLVTSDRTGGFWV